MKKSKVLLYLASFSATEFKEFEKFVASPYFNQKTELIDLLAYLAPFHPDFPEEKVKKGVIIQHVAFNKKNNEKELTYKMSFLFKLVEQFLIISKLEKDNELKDIQLIEALLEKNLKNSFETEMKKKLQDIEKVQYKDSAYYLNSAKLFDLQTNTTLQRKHNENLQKASDFNDYYFFLNKLKYSCSMIDQSKFLKTNYDIGFINETISYLQNSKFINEPLIAIYYNIINIVQGVDAKTKFKLLKNQIFENTNTISQSELKDIYIYAINFCARQIQKNQTEYLQEAFDLYREGIDKKILLNKNELTYWTYSNVVKLGLRLKEFEETETFIFENKDKIPKNLREDTFNYNLAELYYYTNKFDEAQRLINYIKVNDSLLHSKSRVILCKIYFESFDLEPLLSLIASFSIFLKRDKKLAGNMKTFYKNFCDSLFQLLKRNPKKTPAIIEKIKTVELISDREWLLQAAEKIQTEKKWRLLY